MRGLAQVAKIPRRSKGIEAHKSLFTGSKSLGCKQARLILQGELLTELQFTLHRLLKLSKDQAIALSVSNSEILNTLEQYFSTFFSLSPP